MKATYLAHGLARGQSHASAPHTSPDTGEISPTPPHDYEVYRRVVAALMKASIAEDDAKDEQLLSEFIAWYGGLDEYDTAEVDALLEESWLGECLEAAFAE